MKLAVLLISHDRIVDTKIGMELITHLWKSHPLLKSIDIFHAYNGPHALYPQVYLEKKIVRRKNLGHHHGAADLIDAGMAMILNSSKKYDYIFVMSGDTWLIKPEVIAHIIRSMKLKKILLAATLWPSAFLIPNHFATEFFIISGKFAKKIFPLNLVDFFKSRPIDNSLYNLLQALRIVIVPKVEFCFTHKILAGLNVSFWSFHWRKFVCLFPGRQMYYGFNRFYSPKMGYMSHHDLKQKIQLVYKEKKMKNIFSRAPILQNQYKTLIKNQGSN